jgi:hypothetical protein
MRDIKMGYTWIPAPWMSVIHETNELHYPVSRFGSNIYNASISREARLRALEIGADGTIETTNIFFSVYHGRLGEVMRISEHSIERYARDLDQLVGKPSLINDAQAHQLATQWLATVDIDVAALEKQKWVVHQLRYLAKGATDAVTLPLYYVDFGSVHYHFGTNAPNMQDFDEPMVHVEILGTTKELQDITIHNGAFSRRPLLLITNALDLARMHDPVVKRMEAMPSAPVRQLSAAEKQDRRKMLLELKKELEALPPGRTNPPNETEKKDMLKSISEHLKELDSPPPIQFNSLGQDIR